MNTRIFEFGNDQAEATALSVVQPTEFIVVWIGVLCSIILASGISLAEEPIDSGGVIFGNAGHQDGVFLVAPIQSRDVYLVDSQGIILNRWQCDYTLGMSAYLLPDGSILRGARQQPPANFRQPGGSGGRVQRISWDGEVVWNFLYTADRFFSHHDIHPMPNGNVLLTAWDYKRRDEAIAAGRDPNQLAETGVNDSDGQAAF